ncbi:MAG: GTP pyrophosphokinase family protein [Propionibacteriaceae bacterium]|jgi:putative GTP pyrophosphokinase|nr:GTP pyrophosphokinase family protein [Propionibacteriaceae bacterium]
MSVTTTQEPPATKETNCDATPTLAWSEMAALQEALVIYDCALSLISTQLNNLNQAYQATTAANPIERITCRMKTVASIAGKLAGRGLPVTAASAVANLTDLAGARVICSYERDIAGIANLVQSLPDVELITEKDYVSHPKPSGYRSYHMVLSVQPRGLFEEQSCPVEVQIRTAAMDFWASLEHKARYKFGGEIPDHLSKELFLCAEKTHELDQRLFLIHELLTLVNQPRTTGSIH